MKTSNKLLIAGAILAIIGVIGSAYYTSAQFSKAVIIGNGKINTKTIPLANFNGIAATQFDYELIQSSENKVELIADENLLSMFDVKVENEVLGIGIGQGSYGWEKQLKVKIYYTSINNIKLSSSANCTGSIKEPFLSISLSSGADADLDISSDSLTVTNSSGSEFNVKGKTRWFSAKSSSGAKIKAKNLITESCNANASSGALVKVYANKKLDANASSGGDIIYYGNPNTDKIKISSGGSIENGE